MENPKNRIYPKPLTAPVVATSTVTSAVCDVSGYECAGFCAYYGDSGDTLSASLYWTAKLTHCATENGSYTDVASEDVLIAATNAFGLINAPTEDQDIYWIGYNGSYDFVKVVVTPTGTHTYGTEVAIFALLGMPRTQTGAGKVNP